MGPMVHSGFPAPLTVVPRLGPGVHSGLPTPLAVALRLGWATSQLH